jgi:hypothetical protein
MIIRIDPRGIPIEKKRKIVTGQNRNDQTIILTKNRGEKPLFF